MKIKTVSTVLTTNTAGQVVESRPVRTVAGPVLNTAGQWVSPVAVEESADGIPVRFVPDPIVLNSAGQPVAATPVSGGGVQTIASAIRAANALGRAATVLVHGHSHVAGEGAGTGSFGLIGAAPNGVGRRLVAKLQAIGLAADASGFCADYNCPAGAGALLLSSLDPRITLGSGWASDAAVSPLGGRFILQDTGNTGFFDFIPGYTFDKVRVSGPRSASAAISVGVYVDDVLITSINQSGTSGFTVTDIVATGSKVSFRNNSTGMAYLDRVQCRRASQQAEVLIAGQRAATIAQLANNVQAWTPLPDIDRLDVDVGILYAMTNNIASSTTAAAWKSAATPIINKFRETGQAIIVIDPPSSTFNETLFDQYEAAAIALASETGSRICNLRAAFGGTYAAANAAGLMFNVNHPSALGHDLAATMLMAT